MVVVVLDAKVVEAVRVDVNALAGVRQVVLVLGTAEVMAKCLHYIQSISDLKPQINNYKMEINQIT